MGDTAPAAPQQPSTTAWILRHQLSLCSQLSGPFHSHWGISTSGEETLAWTAPPSKVLFPMSTGLCSPEKGITLHPGSSQKPSSRPGGLPAWGALQSFAQGGVPWSHRPIGQMGKLRPGKAKGLLWATVAQWEDRSLEPGSTDSQLVFFLCCRVSLCARTGAWGQGVVSELLCSLK